MSLEPRLISIPSPYVILHINIINILICYLHTLYDMYTCISIYNFFLKV